MKTLAIIVCAAFSIAAAAPEAKGSGGSRANGTGSKASSTVVRGHVTKKGVYVAPHRRTTPDATTRNNYSAPGNYNPNTGKTSK
jgi:hypothetical protein